MAKPAAVYAGHRYTRELDAPVGQLVALVEADFAPEVCNPGVLSVWFAFWGELKFAPHYAEIATSFDGK